MAKKSRKNQIPQEQTADIPVVPEEPATFITAPAPVPTVVTPEPPKEKVQPQREVQPAPKKRVRVRKKTTKHLSVAVLCANPNTRRFI